MRLRTFFPIAFPFRFLAFLSYGMRFDFLNPSFPSFMSMNQTPPSSDSSQVTSPCPLQVAFRGNPFLSFCLKKVFGVLVTVEMAEAHPSFVAKADFFSLGLKFPPLILLFPSFLMSGGRFFSQGPKLTSHVKFSEKIFGPARSPFSKGLFPSLPLSPAVFLSISLDSKNPLSIATPPFWLDPPVP